MPTHLPRYRVPASAVSYRVAELQARGLGVKECSVEKAHRTALDKVMGEINELMRHGRLVECAKKFATLKDALAQLPPARTVGETLPDFVACQSQATVSLVGWVLHPDKLERCRADLYTLRLTTDELIRAIEAQREAK